MNARINLGCGGNRLPPPWSNHDSEIDISKPLPFPYGSAQFIFAEHVVEHITPAQAWGFFKECRRVLKPGGVVRIAVPSIEHVYVHADNEYLAWLKSAGFGGSNRESAVENLIVNHGHLALWSVPLLVCVFRALEFSTVTEHRPGQSSHSELRGIEGHGKVIGERNNLIETIVVEATK